LKYLLLADDLSNQSLFGFKRSLKLKRIALQFCAHINASLRIVHIDDPNQFEYQEPLYKKYLEHVKLNRKKRIEKAANNREVQVEYQLEEGEPIAKLAEILTTEPEPIAIIAGTSNRFGLGRLRIGSRVRRLVRSTKHPVFIFGLKAIRNFEYAENYFRITAVIEADSLTNSQIETLRELTEMFSAQLKIIIVRTRSTLRLKLKNWIKLILGQELRVVDLTALKSQFPTAEILMPAQKSPKRLVLRAVLASQPHVVAVPEYFSISPFSIARSSTIPVVPLRH
jgi:nucleotide-binding universal stress UspA family protein